VDANIHVDSSNFFYNVEQFFFIIFWWIRAIFRSSTCDTGEFIVQTTTTIDKLAPCSFLNTTLPTIYINTAKKKTNTKTMVFAHLGYTTLANCVDTRKVKEEKEIRKLGPTLAN
jgi:hypothetical protein